MCAQLNYQRSLPLTFSLPIAIHLSLSHVILRIDSLIRRESKTLEKLFTCICALSLHI